MKAILCCFLLLSPAALPAQTTWVVECTGRPGTHFTDLPPAVAAAAPGDTIVLISPYITPTGCTSLYRGAVIDKPLKVVGLSELGAPGTAGPAGIWDRLTVRNIPAGQEVVLANLCLGSRVVGPPYSVPPHGLLVENCAGRVHLERVCYNGAGLANGELRFQDCADVSIHRATFWTPEQPVTFRRSNVVLSETVFNDSYPHAFTRPPISIATTVDSILVDDSTVRMTDCIVWGAGRAQDPFVVTSPVYFPARRAATVLSGTLLLGPGARLYGGAVPDPWAPGGFVYSEAIDNGGSVVMDPRSNHTGMLGGGARRTQPLHSVWILDPVIHNQTFGVWIGGPPNGFGVLAVGSAARQPLSFWFGDLLLDPMDLMMVGAGILDSEGFLGFQLHAWRGLPLDHLFAFQAGYLGTSTGLTPASRFTALWEGGRTWP